MTELEKIAQQISLCTRCPLRASATQPVPGIGEGRKYFILGEAPGNKEDKTGIPFVGASGKRLDQLMKLGKLDLKSAYISNVCRCRPPVVAGKLRAPRKAERLACYPYLKEELKIIQPEVIITLGATPLSLFTEHGITQLHGTQFKTVLELDDMKLPVEIWASYHPAAAMHQPRLWAVILDDWEHPPGKVDASYIIADPSPRYFSQTIAVDTESAPDGGIGQWSAAYRDSDGRLTVAPYYGADKGMSFNGETIFQNAKYDLRELKSVGMKLPPPENVRDTMIAAYCLGLGRQQPKDTGKSGDNLVGGLGLKYLARRHLGMEMTTWEQVKNHPELVPEYNAHDSVATYLLFEKWRPILPQHFWDIDTPLLDVLMSMEDRGIQVDSDFIKTYAEEVDVRLDEIKNELPLNPYSPKEVANYVYGTLGYPVTRKTETGQPSTEKEVLETIDDPIIRRIIEYKDFYQERTTYISNYVNRMDLDNRIHCEFKQTSTSTGRLSAARPNLQNVTKDTPDHPSKLRGLFIAGEGKSFVRVDWSQVELRVFAALTGDEEMKKVLLSGQDIHQATADMLGVSRDDAKINNFLTLYGGTPWAISREFHITLDNAKAFQADYYRKYPSVKRYMDEQREIALAERKVKNYYGRVCRLDGMFADDWKTKEDAIRLAVNMPIQGTAGDIVKRAMIVLHYKYHLAMVLQVHDELLTEMPTAEAKDCALWLKEFLPTVTEINGMTFPVEASTGANWLEAMRKDRKL